MPPVPLALSPLADGLALSDDSVEAMKLEALLQGWDDCLAIRLSKGNGSVANAGLATKCNPARCAAADLSAAKDCTVVPRAQTYLGA